MKLPKHYAFAFQRILNEKAVDFSSLLRTNEALVAGGSVLSALVDSEFNDFDVYVHVDNTQKFFADLDRFFTNQGIEYMFVQENIPKYDNSFMVKNGILLRCAILVKVSETKLFNMDIMLIDRPPLKVVNNFDLTIVQSWYDGVDVYTSHPRETLSKISYINQEYLSAFIEGDYFIDARVDKYDDRGFLIYSDRVPTAPNHKINEAWLIRKLHNRLIETKKYSAGHVPYGESFPHILQRINMYSDFRRNQIMKNTFKSSNSQPGVRAFQYVLKDNTKKEFQRLFELTDRQFFDLLVSTINTAYWLKYMIPYANPDKNPRLSFELDKFEDGIELDANYHLAGKAKEKYDVPYDVNSQGFHHAGQLEFYRYVSPSFDYLVKYTENNAPPELQIKDINRYIAKHDIHNDPGEPYKTIDDYEKIIGFQYYGYRDSDLSNEQLIIEKPEDFSSGFSMMSVHIKPHYQLQQEFEMFEEEKKEDMDNIVNNLNDVMGALDFTPTRINPRVPFVHERQRRNLSEVDVQDQLDRDAWRLNTLVDYYKSNGIKPRHDVYGLRPSEVEDLLNDLDPKWQQWVPRGFFL